MNLHVESMCVYLWGDTAENAGSSSDEVSNKQGEARQAEEEETRRAGTDDGVQHILMTHTHTHKHVNRKQTAISTLISLSINYGLNLIQG